MAKMFTYIFVMSTIMLLMYFGGVLNQSELGGVSDLATINETDGHITLNDWQDTRIYSFVWAIGLALAAALVTGITASFFGGSAPSERLYIAGKVFVSGGFLFSYLIGMWSIINKVNSTSCSSGLCGNWITALIIIIMGPIAIGYIFSVIEWVTGGSD